MSEGLLNSFSKAEYLMVFVAFVYSYIATLYFGGWARWLQERREVSVSTNHVLFSVLIFLILIDFWWISFQRGPRMTASFSLFLLSLLSPLNMSVLAFNTFPRDHTRHENPTAYFLRRSRFLFIVLAFDFLSNVFADYYLLGTPFLDLENVFRSVGILFCIVGAIYPTPAVVRVFAVAGFAVLGIHMIYFGEPLVTNVGYGLEEHMTIFLTFVYGFIVSRFFSGWSYILERAKDVHFSKRHLLWSLLAFALLMDFWWSSWNRESFVARHLLLFLAGLILPVVLFRLTIALFPFQPHGETVNLKEYFDRKEGPIIALFGLVILVNGILANSMEEDWNSSENMFRGAAVALSLTGYLWKNHLVRAVVLVNAIFLFVLHAALE